MPTGWTETLGFTPRERAALEWKEAVTLVTECDVPDAVLGSSAKWSLRIRRWRLGALTCGTGWASRSGIRLASRSRRDAEGQPF